jgi:hypothetical protein
MISIPHFKTYLKHNNYSYGVCVRVCMWMIQSITTVKDLITDCCMPARKVVVYYKYYNTGTVKRIYSGKLWFRSMLTNLYMWITYGQHLTL